MTVSDLNGTLSEITSVSAALINERSIMQMQRTAFLRIGTFRRKYVVYRRDNAGTLFVISCPLYANSLRTGMSRIYK